MAPATRDDVLPRCKRGAVDKPCSTVITQVGAGELCDATLSDTPVAASLFSDRDEPQRDAHRARSPQLLHQDTAPILSPWQPKPYAGPQPGDKISAGDPVCPTPADAKYKLQSTVHAGKITSHTAPLAKDPAHTADTAGPARSRDLNLRIIQGSLAVHVTVIGLVRLHKMQATWAFGPALFTYLASHLVWNVAVLCRPLPGHGLCLRERVAADPGLVLIKLCTLFYLCKNPLGPFRVDDRGPDILEELSLWAICLALGLALGRQLSTYIPCSLRYRTHRSQQPDNAAQSLCNRADMV